MNKVKSNDGTFIAYDVSGSGPTLIYITGAICHRTFFPVKKDVEILSKNFTVYNYDRRGRGDSDIPQSYTLQNELEDIEALIDVAGGTAYVMGHSSGAVLALEAGLKIPNKVLKVVSHDASYVHDEQEKLEYSNLCNKVNHFLKLKNNTEAISTFLKGIGMPKVFVFLVPLIPGWKKIKALAPTLVADMNLTCDMAPFQKFTEIQVPVCILYGEKCPKSIVEVANQLASSIPRSSLVKLEGEDHLANTKVVLPIITNFFNTEVHL